MISCYKLWHELKIHIKKSSKYTLGEKIDAAFIETLELVFIAQYLQKNQKLPTLQKANTKFDTLKFFLSVLWEVKDIETKHYAMLSEKLAIIGRMLGGWLRRFDAAAPPAMKK